MAEIKLTQIEHLNLAVFEICGDVANGEILRFLEANFQSGDGEDTGIIRAIFDFRAADLSALTLETIKVNLARVEKFLRPGLRAALVFSNPADFSIGKTISTAFRKHSHLLEIRHFYNLYRAKDWLLYCDSATTPQAALNS